MSDYNFETPSGKKCHVTNYLTVIRDGKTVYTDKQRRELTLDGEPLVPIKREVPLETPAIRTDTKNR